MTDDLTDLEAIAQAATPGPWREGWLGTVLDDSGKAVCQRAYDDAAFIAAARDAVPSLIARVRKAEAERDAAWDQIHRDQHDAMEARAALARAEALAEEYARNGAEREAVGAPAWPNNVARDIRTALTGGDDRG